MPLLEFEPTISAGERPQTYALDCAGTGIGIKCVLPHFIHYQHVSIAFAIIIRVAVQEY